MDCSIKLEGQQYLENNDWVFGSKIVGKDEVSNIEEMWKGKKWLLTDSAREVFGSTRVRRKKNKNKMKKRAELGTW